MAEKERGRKEKWMSTGKGSKSIVGADAAQTARCVRSAAIKYLLVAHRAERARVDHIETHTAN